MLLGRRGRSRAATVADGAWEDEMRLLARKLSQHRDRPRHRFLGSQGLNYGWSNIFVNLCCSRIGASFDVAVALCQTMLSRLAPKASVFLSVFKGACVNLCCCQPRRRRARKGFSSLWTLGFCGSEEAFEGIHRAGLHILPRVGFTVPLELLEESRP